MIQINAAEGCVVNVTDKPIYNVIGCGNNIQYNIDGDKTRKHTDDVEVHEEVCNQTVTRGPGKQFLFVGDKPTEENITVRNREKDRFIRYLSEHKMGSRQLVCDKKDTLNDIVTCFLTVWMEKGITSSSPSGGAVFRFLTDECGMKSTVTERSYSNEIKERIKNKDYDVRTMQDVRKCFNE
jgi:hypothetical protein